MDRKNQLLWRFFKINLAKVDDRNAWYLVLEIFWASILGSVATFNAAYAIRLGADNFQVSLLSSIPALVAVLVSFPAGVFLQRRRRRTPWVLGSLQVYRVGYLLVAAAPWMHFFGIQPGMMVVLILVMISIPGNIFNVGWTPLLAEIVPEHRRAAVFTARNIINQATVSVVVFLCGQWLSRMVFPINYQVLFAFGFLVSLLSSYYLLKLEVPESHVQAVEAGEDGSPDGSRARIHTLKGWVGYFKRSALDLREEVKQYPEFGRITTNTLLHGLGMWMAGPLYALYFVRQLNASDAWLGLNGTLGCIGTIVGYSLWRWLIVRWGEPLCLKRTIVLAGGYPILVGLMPALPVILVLGMMNGLIAPGVNLSHYNTLLRVIPADSRPRYTAIYMTIMNLGAFVCPMISLAIANWIGITPMLVVGGLLSVIGSSSFWWHPVQGKELRPVVEAGI